MPRGPDPSGFPLGRSVHAYPFSENHTVFVGPSLPSLWGMSLRAFGPCARCTDKENKKSRDYKAALSWPGICMSEITWAGRPSPSDLGISSDLAAVVSPAAVISLAGAYGRLRQSPIVGTVLHLAPSGAPPFGQNTDTSVSVSSQLTAPPSCTYRRPA